MVQLQNKFLEVLIHPKGAELQQLIHKSTKRNILWKGDPAIWGKFSPLLFPIVGTLKDHVYYYKGNAYKLPRHGFARDMHFEVLEQHDTKATFLLVEDATTRAVYPFSFSLKVHYTLVNTHLQIRYEVLNPSNEAVLYFSIGAHPAFAVPLQEELNFNDYYLEFEKDETLFRFPLTEQGLIHENPIFFHEGASRVNLDKSMFRKDAWVFKNLQSECITLRSDKDSHGWHVRWTDFPFLGIWSTQHADFVCIEPWCGIADTDNHHQELIKKEGMHSINPGEEWVRQWTIEPF